VSKPAIVDFPTPPFADDTAITFLTSFIFRRSGNPRCMRGMLPLRGRPWLNISALVIGSVGIISSLPADFHAAGNESWKILEASCLFHRLHRIALRSSS